MPKKTKKEKLLAAQHRTKLPIVIADTITTATNDTANTFRLNLSASNTPVKQTSVLASANEFSAIKHDLIKTLVITASIIASEFLLAHYLPH